MGTDVSQNTFRFSLIYLFQRISSSCLGSDIIDERCCSFSRITFPCYVWHFVFGKRRRMTVFSRITFRFRLANTTRGRPPCCGAVPRQLHSPSGGLHPTTISDRVVALVRPTSRDITSRDCSSDLVQCLRSVQCPAAAI